MARLSFSRAGFGILALVVLMAASLSPAKDGRDFAGFYELGEVTDLGEFVRVPLTVRVFNYSDADVVGAKITLEDSLLPGEDLGSFAQIVNIRDRESARVSDSFLVPRREYDRWQQGVPPHLRIEYKDANENQQRHMVGLVPMLVPEEE